MPAFTAVTECPTCKTAFLVALEQLDQADGQVRCGSCLAIFHAHKSMIVEQKNLFSMAGEVLNASADTASIDTSSATEPTSTQQPLSLDEDEDIADEFSQLMNSDVDIAPYLAEGSATDSHFSEPEQSQPEDSVAVEDCHGDRDERIARRQAAQAARAAWRSSSSGNRLFILGVAIASLLLLLQVIWLFSNYQNTDKSRFYCLFEDCSNIASANRYFEVLGTVKPSVESEDILIAKIELQNKDLTRAHSLPNVIITFEDADGNIQAGREFTPKIYLGPEQRQIAQLSANQQIAFEIAFLHPQRGIKSFSFSVNSAE